jgi:hypothetical protein
MALVTKKPHYGEREILVAVEFGHVR